MGSRTVNVEVGVFILDALDARQRYANYPSGNATVWCGETKRNAAARMQPNETEKQRNERQGSEPAEQPIEVPSGTAW
jgi:hypothetical protein